MCIINGIIPGFLMSTASFTRCVLGRYVRQFREIFTEEGRRQVKITHQVPGRAPVVTYTQVCNTAAPMTTKAAASSSASQSTTSTAQVDDWQRVRR